MFTTFFVLSAFLAESAPRGSDKHVCCLTVFSADVWLLWSLMLSWAGFPSSSSADPVAADESATRGQPTELCLLVAAQKVRRPPPYYPLLHDLGGAVL